MIDGWEIKFEEDLLKSGVIGYHISKNEKYMHIQYVWYHNRFVVKSGFSEKETRNIFLELFENRKKEVIEHVKKIKEKWDSNPLLYRMPDEYDIEGSSIFIYFEETNQIFNSSLESFKESSRVCAGKIQDIDVNLDVLKEKYNIKELSIDPARGMDEYMFLYYEVTIVTEWFESNDTMLEFAWTKNRIRFSSAYDIEMCLDLFIYMYREYEEILNRKRKEKRLSRVFLWSERYELKNMDEQELDISSTLSNQHIKSTIKEIKKKNA